MCRGKQSLVADEAWDEEQVGSSDESEIDSEAEPESKKPSLQSQSTTSQKPALSKKLDVQPAMLGMSIPTKSQAPIASSVPRDSQGELVKLVNHLRNDNARLHEALAQAHRSLEIVAENQAARDAAPNIDFAHLLALVKDFGDSAGALEGFEHVETNQEDAFQAFDIASPRGSENGESSALPIDGDVSELKKELENMRHEMSLLRAEMSLKDAELTNLRSATEIMM